MSQCGLERAVAFVEGTLIGAGEHCVRAAIDLGLIPVFVSTDPDSYTFLDRYPCEIIKIQQVDVQVIITALKRLSAAKNLNFIGIGTTNDNALITVIRIAQELSLSHAPIQATENCKNKSVTRSLLPCQSPNVIYVDRYTDLDKMEHSTTSDYVVKPTHLNSGLGVKHCKNWNEVSDHVQYLQGTNGPCEATDKNEVLIEEYVDGQEFSVEIFDGSALGVTQIGIDNSAGFVEISHLHPADCSQELIFNLMASAEEAVKVTGLIWGPAHVQYRSNGPIPKLIEINPRLGGGNVTQCVECARGIRLAHAYVKKICQLSGVEEELQASKYNFSAVQFVLTKGADPVSEIIGLEKALEFEFVVEVGTRARIGGRYSARGSNHDRLAFAITSASSAADANSAALEAAQHIDIVTRIE